MRGLRIERDMAMLVSIFDAPNLATMYAQGGNVTTIAVLLSIRGARVIPSVRTKLSNLDLNAKKN